MRFHERNRKRNNKFRPPFTTASKAGVPVAGLSFFDPIYLGIDEDGQPCYIELAYRNLLLGGEPGGGKSGLLQNILGHASQCTDVQLWLLDGKRLELGMWAPVADMFIGPDITQAIAAMAWLQAEIDRRTDVMLPAGLRKIEAHHRVEMLLVVIDELAYFSATVGDVKQREDFTIRVRDVVARGRAVGIIVVAATQRPSADIIPTSLRDIFSYRCAFRCTTDVSSDIVLGFGWAGQGYTANSIAPEDRGIGFLLAEGGIPKRFRAAYLTDADIAYLVARSLHIRGNRSTRGNEGQQDEGGSNFAA